MEGFKIFHCCCQILPNNLFPKMEFCKNTSFFIIFPTLIKFAYMEKINNFSIFPHSRIQKNYQGNNQISFLFITVIIIIIY